VGRATPHGVRETWASPAKVNRRALRITQGRQAPQAPRAAHPALSRPASRTWPSHLHRGPALPPPRTLSATAHETGISARVNAVESGFKTSKQAWGARCVLLAGKGETPGHVALRLSPLSRETRLLGECVC